MKKQNLLYGCGAFCTMLFSQTAGRGVLTFNPAALPATASGCTGICGSCGGSCAGILGTLFFLGACAIHKKSAE